MLSETGKFSDFRGGGGGGRNIKKRLQLQCRMPFLKRKCLNSNKISVIYVPRRPINNKPALIQVMAWCRTVIILNKDGIVLIHLHD